MVSRLPQPGSDDGTWGEILNDYLSVAHNSDGTVKDGSVGTSSMQNGAVGTTQLADSAVTLPKINTSNVAGSGQTLTFDGTDLTWVTSGSGVVPDANASTKGIMQLAGDLAGAGGTAAAPLISAGAVTGAKIANTTITDANISAGAAIAKSKLASLSIVDADVSTISEGKITGLTSDLNGKVPTTRLISTSTGLSGGGDLSADRTLSVTADTTTQRIDIAKNGTLTGTRKQLNLIEGSNVTITQVDNSGSNRVDVTIAAASAPTLTAQDEGSTLTSAATSFNFTGAGVTASNVSGAVTVNVPASPIENVNTVAASGAAVTIPDVTTATINLVTLTANCTFTFPTAAAGKSFTLILQQDATGSRTVTWPIGVKWPGGITPALTATANAVDYFSFLSPVTSWNGFLTGNDVK